MAGSRQRVPAPRPEPCGSEMARARGFPVPPVQTEASSGTRAGAGGSSAADRLSSLPDCVLHHVLSFLKAPQAVRTCVLSKRWRHLRSSMPCLDIDRREFPNPAVEGEFDEFEDFTNNLLMFHRRSVLGVSGSARWIWYLASGR